jgi:hypothetical protein
MEHQIQIELATKLQLPGFLEQFEQPLMLRAGCGERSRDAQVQMRQPSGPTFVAFVSLPAGFDSAKV